MKRNIKVVIESHLPVHGGINTMEGFINDDLHEKPRELFRENYGWRYGIVGNG